MNRGFLFICAVVFGALVTALIVSEYQIYELRKDSELTVEINISGNDVVATARDGKIAVETRRSIPSTDSLAYAKGVNDALMGIALYHLELEIQGQRKTFHGLSQVVMKRLKVTPDERWKE